MGVAGGVGVQEEEQKKEDEARSNFYRASVVLLHIDNRHTTHTSTLIEKKREREKGEGGRGKGSTRRFTHSISVWHTQRKSTPFEAE